jgi:2-dehydropantoate 2-reductase
LQKKVVKVLPRSKKPIRECVTLKLNIGLSESELMAQITLITNGSDQLISTLQDIRSGRLTEIEFLNLEIARVAASMEPKNS